MALLCAWMRGVRARAITRFATISRSERLLCLRNTRALFVGAIRSPLTDASLRTSSAPVNDQLRPCSNQPNP